MIYDDSRAITDKECVKEKRKREAT